MASGWALMSRPAGRPLTQLEAEAIRFMLAAKPPERFETAFAVLRDQVAHTSVVGGCDCGCPTVDLAVSGDHARPAAAFAGALDLPVAEALHKTEPYELLLFVGDGWLKTLELVTYHNGPPPSEMPRLDDFSPPAYAPYF